MESAPPQPCDLAFVLPDLRLGGAQRVAVNLVHAWLEQHTRVCVITIAGRDTDFFRLDPRVPRIALGMQQPTASILGALAGNVRRLASLRAAIVATGAHRVLAFVAGTNVLTLLATRRLGVRVVISERNDPARQRIGSVWNSLRSWTYRWADAVTANSDTAMQALAAFVPRQRLAFIANGLAVPDAGNPQPARERTFLAVGRLHHQKGFDVLLSAFAAARPQCPGWRLIIAGGGEDLRSLGALAEQLGLSENVDFPGAVEDPFALYRRASVFVLPSRFEGTPNALLEAMACGVPVVVSDAISDVHALVGDTGAGVVVPSEDSVAMARALCELAADEGGRRRMGAAAAGAVRDQSLGPVLSQWNAILAL